MNAYIDTENYNAKSLFLVVFEDPSESNVSVDVTVRV